MYDLIYSPKKSWESPRSKSKVWVPVPRMDVRCNDSFCGPVGTVLPHDIDRTGVTVKHSDEEVEVDPPVEIVDDGNELSCILSNEGLGNRAGKPVGSGKGIGTKSRLAGPGFSPDDSTVVCVSGLGRMHERLELGESTVIADEGGWPLPCPLCHPVPSNEAGRKLS